MFEKICSNAVPSITSARSLLDPSCAARLRISPICLRTVSKSLPSTLSITIPCSRKSAVRTWEAFKRQITAAGISCSLLEVEASGNSRVTITTLIKSICGCAAHLPQELASVPDILCRLPLVPSQHPKLDPRLCKHRYSFCLGFSVLGHRHRLLQCIKIANATCQIAGETRK